MLHDVVIVGAGPAGSAAAASLASRGRDVVLVDRHAFPRDKTCGDGVPPGTIELLNSLGMEAKIRRAGFYPIHTVRLGSPRGRMWETRFEARRPGTQFCIARRVEFDALIRDHAVECGARFVQAAVTGAVVERGNVTGVIAKDGEGERRIGARVVIGADGATSAIARSLGPGKPPARSRAVAMRAYVDGVDVAPHTVEFYFYKQFLPGYAWVFPLGDRRANVGVIVRADRFKKSGRALGELFDDFVRVRAIRGRVEGVAAWQLPLAAGPAPRRAFDGALLVGDAGWFVDSLTGEGIHNAVRSAMIAADVVDDALAGGDTSQSVLSAYERRCEEALGGLLARAYRYHRLIASAPPVLEALFVAANAGQGLVRAWLNRVSTDFVIRA